MPRYITFRNATRENISLGDHIRIADNLLTRVIGLLNKKSISPGEGLWITPCNSIHMYGMKFPIDVLFLRKDFTAVHLVHNIAPGKQVWPIKEAHSVLELPPGTLLATGCQPGDQLERIHRW